MTAAPATRPAHRLPVGVPVAIVAAWVVAVVADAAGKGRLLHHDTLATGRIPVAVALVVFLVSWQLMIAAMMLPSALPLVRLFHITSAGQDRPGAVMAAFLGGYAAVWTLFGLVALGGDAVVHATVDAVPALAARPSIVAGVVLVIAGAFQFTPLKDRCLTTCRHPALWLMHHYRRGVWQAFDLGREHGQFCLGCCWALMLVAFAAGVADLVWMAALATLMAYEKIGRRGVVVGRVAGVALVGWGLVVVVHPGWLPGPLGGPG